MKMKKYNMTEKLAFDENPVITIKDVDIEITADAKVILQVASAMETEETFKAVSVAYDLLFSDSEKKKIDKLQLKAGDFTKCINAAVILAMGGEPDEEGEA